MAERNFDTTAFGVYTDNVFNLLEPNWGLSTLKKSSSGKVSSVAQKATPWIPFATEVLRKLLCIIAETTAHRNFVLDEQDSFFVHLKHFFCKNWLIVIFPKNGSITIWKNYLYG